MKKEKAMEEIKIDLATKDQHIVELDKHFANLKNQINRLNLELDKAKGVVEDAYAMSF